jgi:aminoglycoside 3-N-acetyltransferase
MSELHIIESTRTPNTVESIENDLVALGILEGDLLLVHSSLSSLGWVCGGEQAVIMALLHTLGPEGTLVMPAHSSHISDPAEWGNPPIPSDWLADIYLHMPAFHPDLTPTRGMGSIAELFRTMSPTIRSLHPQSSFAAQGPLAHLVTQDHLLTPQLGQSSPLGRLYDLDAKVLLLGVGYDSCTSFHLAETLNESMPMKRMGAAMEEEGSRTWKWFEDYDYNSDDFESLGKAMERHTAVSFGKVGKAQCKLFSIRKAVDFAAKWLNEQRFSN